MDFQENYERLKTLVLSYGKAAVAFSGGVDSSFLSKVCFDVLGRNAIAITLVSSMNPKSEIKQAEETARLIGIPHYLVRDDDIEEKVSENTPDRCYYCKSIEFAAIQKKASELGFDRVLDGSNLDDLSDYRPGLRALKELGISSPLREAELTKKDIRELSKMLGLPTWDKPAKACLASRIPYGEKITEEKLSRIERSEGYIQSKGFIQFRVRSHGDMARIEISPDERVKMLDLELMNDISRALKTFGFVYVAMELEGYKTGNLNAVLDEKRRTK